jgi:amino acid adenylation domain-containing protein
MSREVGEIKMAQETFATISELLESAAEAGVFLSYSPAGLHYKLTAEVFPEEIKSEIAANRAALIEFLRQRQLDEESAFSRPAIRPFDRTLQKAPLSFAQQRLWFIDQFGGGSVQYNMPAAMRVRGRFDEEIAEQSLRCLIRRHEPLRTTFINGEDAPLQQIQASFDFHLTRIDLGGVPRDAQERAVAEALKADAVKPFDLSADLMLRASFIRLSADEGVLLFNLHHIASDGWSMGILVNEFARLYEAFSQGRPDPLQPLAIQYADYAQWQREWLAGEVLERQLAYWEKQLTALPQVHTLPLDRPRPAVQSFNGATHTLDVGRATLDGLKEVARSGHTTLFMMLQGVFALLLSRHSNSNDIVLGTPVANRPVKELEPLVGFFVNTLVLRTDCSAGQTFHEYLAQVRRLNLDAQAHQDVPFEYLVERLKPHRSASHSALFQIMFSMNTNEAAEAHLSGATLTPLQSDEVTVKFDLALDATEHADGLRLTFAYNRDLFDAATMVRMGEHLKTLMRRAVADPDAKIETLPLLSEGERRHLLFELNETAVEYPREICLPQLIEAQVGRTPDAVALSFEGSQLTYRELNERANRLAHYLRARGVGPDTLVGLCLERSPEMVVAILGIVKAGGAYVPLDPGYPRDRLAFMLEDSAVPVLLTQHRLLPLLDSFAGEVFCLDSDWEEVSRHSAEEPAVELADDNLAYVIYTSGSTGRPKGAMNTHGALRNRLLWMQDEYRLTPDDRVLQKTPFSFDVSVWEFFWPLLTGARLVVARPGGHQDGAYLVRAIVEEGITTLHFVPSMLQVFLEEEGVGRCASLRRVICSGEALPAELEAQFFKRLGAGLHNLYGPTEAAVDVTFWACERESRRRSVPIGRPVANTQLYILDGGMRPVPAGATGELYIGGVQLARGYLGRAGLTAERFVPDPFSGGTGARLYRTGDLARHLLEGEIEFLGRIDHQVKLRGFRIELGEIEAALAGVEGLKAAAAVVREDQPGQKRLVAYVTPEGEGWTGEREAGLIVTLRQALQSRLPDYMVPSAFVLLGEMPLTSSGKVDRKALPAPQYYAADAQEPTSPTEQILCAIFTQVLRLESVGVNDNFFELGGHSLLATQVVSRVKSAFDVDLPLRVLFESPTVAAIAQHVQLGTVSRPPIRPLDRAVQVPQFSYAQQRLWFIDRFGGGSPQYNMPAALRIRGRFDEETAERVLRRIVERHEPLRTLFLDGDEGPRPLIRESFDFNLNRVDLSGLEPDARERAAAEAVEEDAARPFDLDADLMLRASFLRLSDDEGVLLFNVHHIASDGWSIGILGDEFSKLYAAFSRGEDDPLEPLAIQYADYAQWQREWLSGEVLEEQVSYWERQLADLPQVHSVPLDRPRPAQQTFEGAVHKRELDSAALDALKGVAARNQTTLFMVLQGLFALLVSRHSNSSDVVMGTPVANRVVRELEPLVGFFVNTLVLRTNCAAGRTFREYLAEVRRVNLEAQANQDLPFEYLVERLRPQRNASHSALFQIMFSMNTNEAAPAGIEGLELEPLTAERVAVKFDLTLEALEIDGALRLTFAYNRDLFEARTVERMGEHLMTLIEGVIADPGQKIERLPLLSGAERERLVAGLNATAAEYPGEASVPELFEAQAARTPEAVALVCGDTRLTYREFNERVNRLARYLRKHGAGAEMLVAIYMERRVEMLVSVLGVLKAGAAYLPLDPSYPQERLAFMLQDSRSQVLLTNEGLLDRLPHYGGTVVAVDRQWEEIAQESPENLSRVPLPESVAYTIYTSGSTGKPKGVQISHRALTNFLWTMREWPGLGERDVVLAETSLSFDIAGLELYLPLIVGARIRLVGRETAMEGALLQREMEQGVTVMQATPSGWLLLLESGWEGSPGLKALCGGEALSADLAAKLAARCDSLWNMYGPTETTIWSLVDEMGGGGQVTIGRPIANTTVYVLDGSMELVPEGVAGELYIGGDGLARGYLNRGALTAERFVPDPFGPQPGARLYKTGDVVRHLLDGRVEYLGRADQQVKLRGYRIELGEIEQQLASVEGVEAAAALMREDEPGQKCLVAYVRMEEAARRATGEQETIAALRHALQSRLPDYMVPSAFVVLDEMPLTPNGKLDRNVLPAPKSSAPAAAEPTSPVEQLLCAIFAQVLRLEGVGINDDFFELGGHSLLATQVVARINSTFEADVSLRTLFEFPTVADLARQVQLALPEEPGWQAPPVVPVDRSRPLPLSHAQQRLWFIDQLELGSPLYNIPLALRLTGRFDIAAAESSFNEIIRRHEVLRTSFATEDGKPVQVIGDYPPLILEVVDLSGEDEDEPADSRVEHLARREAQQPFDLGTGPLLRAKLLRLADEEHILLLTVHHIAADGWSFGILIREFSALYESFLQGRPAGLPDLPLQYADFAVWQNNWLRGEALEGQLAYWRGQLDSLTPLELPTDFPRPAVASHKGETITFQLDEELSRKLKELSRQHNVTLFMSLMAAFQVLLSRYTGQTDIAVGTDIANRNRLETESLVGFFVNELVLRADLSANPTFAELLRQVRRTTLDAYIHQDLPFEKLVDELQPQRDLSRAPLFQVKLVLQNAARGDLRLPDVHVTLLEEQQHEVAKFDLAFVFEESGPGLKGSLEFATDLFSRSTAERLLSHFQTLLRAVADDPTRCVRSLPLLTTGERERLLFDFNDTARDYPRSSCVHQLFRARVEASPEAVSVVYEGQTLSYRQLDERANRLAHYLLGLGVGAEFRVAVCMERSADMVVALLGILKAGAAYVPIDPAYPIERMAWLLRDSQCPVLLTQESLQDALPTQWIHVLCVDSEWDEVSSFPETDPETPVRADNLAYVIYTSGSTGTPKGVEVAHRGIVRLLMSADYAQFDPSLAFLQISPVSFDASTLEIWAPLLHGGRCVLYPERIPVPDRLAAFIQDNQVNSAWLTSSLFNAVMDEMPQALAPLRQLLVGGEALSVSHVSKAAQLLGSTRLINGYGPTEGTTFTCCYPIPSDADALAAVRSMPIGTPISNTRVYILDSEYELMPVGVAGELFIAGDGLARDYLNRPGLTAERFVPDPFSREVGGRLYRSGDLARWTADGTVEYLGRIDQQVKLRGFRIELGEIESHLRNSPAVQDAAVLLREDEPGEKRLVAYVVPSAQAWEDVEDLRAYLRHRLPDYMVPAHFVLLDELPLTPNGKLDRRALPAPAADAADSAALYVAPRNPVEEAICEVWQEVLRRERVGIEDNFFSLGGDSILSIRVVSLLKGRGIALNIKDIFQHQTVAQLAAHAQQGTVAAEPLQLEPFALLTEEERASLADEYEDAYPMSALQAGMVFHTQLEGFTGVYHDIMSEHVRCAWDEESLARALSDCVQGHPLLRTGFLLDRERPLQVVHRSIELPLEVEDLRHLSAEEQEVYISEWTEERKRHVFDWERGPLFSVHVFRRTDESFQFVISFHHAVLDGWSRAVLSTELYNRYERLLSGRELEAAETEWTYRDFVAQEQRVLADPEAKQYFAEMLEDAPAQQLPRSKAAGGGERSQGRFVVEGFALLSSRLIELSRALGVPVQAVLLAGHFKVLATMSGQRRAVSCVTHNGRPESAGAERSVGLYLNSLPLSLELRDGSWRELIGQVAGLRTSAMQYRGYPLSKIQQDVGTSFGEVSFNYTHFHAYRDLVAGSGQTLEVLSSSGLEQTNFDLLVDIARAIDGDTMSMFLIYEREVFGEEMIARLGRYYATAFEQMLAELDAPHHSEILLGKEELERLLLSSTGAAGDYPLDLCFHQLFARQATQTPHAVAVTYGTRSLTYGELDEKSGRLSRYLSEAGVGKKSRVGIHLRRSPEVLIGLLGVLKAGAAYVPLEAGLPPQRLRYLLEDSRVEWVLVESGLMAGLPLSGVDVVVMDGASSDAGWLEEFATADEPRERATPDSLAYILYTSGSTGQPKGVMVEHRGLTNYLSHAAEAYLAEGVMGSVVSSPLGFDATLTTLLAPLVAGRRVELLPDDERTISQLAGRLFGAAEALLFKLTPAHLEALQYLEKPVETGQAAHVIVVGGEQLGAGLLTKWKGELPHASFVNEYGPTEAVVGCTIWTLSDEDGLAELEGRAAAPIGHPIANTQVYVLDSNLRPAPEGVSGEVYIGGVGVARGYVNLEELTEERFVADPFSQGGRLYKTGDVGRWTSAGELEYLGRNDSQVKLRGYRIELGEIEQQLAALEGVASAVVVAREDEPGQKRLIAYVTLGGSNGHSAGESEVIGGLHAALRSVLPEYMVPSAFVLLDELPLTPNGKVDRKALPAPDAVQAEAVDYVAPRNAVEQAICEVWQEVLKYERVGVEDNFFSLGGDSILSIRVVSLLKRRGLSVEIRDIFQHQTVALLARQAREGGTAEESELEPFALLTEEERGALGDEYEDAYPMSALQAGMVFHTQLEGFTGVYHDIMAEHVRCPWDEEKFERALATCIAEHPVLRTGFLLGMERPLQVIYRSIEPPLEVRDLCGLSQEEQERYLESWTEQHKRHVFDWERGPLFQINIFLRTNDSIQFVLSFHHAVLDGWSRAVLTTQLYNRYERLLSGVELEPAETDWTYRDFVAQEQRTLEDTAARQFFAEMLEDAPAQQLPRLKTDTGVQRSQGRLQVEDFTPLSGRLIELSRRLGVPIQSVLLAAHFKVLSTMGGQPHAVTCVTQNGRPETARGERSLGLYLNSLPISLDLGGGSWRELIGRVAGVSARGLQYRSYPLSKIQQELGWSFSEVLFNYTHFHVFNDLTRSEGRALETLGSAVFEQTNFELLADFARGVGNDLLFMTLVYEREVFDDGLMERFGRYYVRAFELMLDGLDEPHDAHPLLGGRELRRLLVEWSGAGAEYGAGVVPLHRLFEVQAEATPDATALVFRDEELTYAELNAWADGLARRLRARGVGPDVLVGLCAERSPAMVAALLGVLKAGGAYVPLDPTYPGERLRYMLEDSGVSVLLTDEHLLPLLDSYGGEVVCLDSEWRGGGEAEGGNWAGAEVDGEHLAYVLYTSGSTGRPKGVMVEHRGLTNYLSHAAEAYLAEGVMGSVVSSPLGFDATLTTLLAPLVAGRRVELLPDDERTISQLAGRLFGSAEALLFKLTPAHLEALQYVERPARTAQAAHVIVVGGEQLGARLLSRWRRELLPHSTFVNEYGPTETVVGCTTWTLSDEAGLAELEGKAAAPIGCPIANTQVYVLDAQLRPSPEGVTGELYIGGAGVARGYLNSEGLTRERFIADPFSQGGRLYKTGDLGRWSAGGVLEYLGRNDSQVKLRGYRIELGEIEQQLAGVEGVKAAAAVAREDVPGQKRLVAYVTLEEEARQGASEAEVVGMLRTALQSRLPEYMVPAAFVLLDELPLTPNGKVDRKALPAPDAGQGQSAQYVAPRNAVEEAICEVWQEVLRRERVGVEDNFLNLGGDSMLSIRVVSLLKSRSIFLDVIDIFQHQTISQLAEQAGRARLEQEPFTNLKHIAHMVINEHDELDENSRETVL